MTSLLYRKFYYNNEWLGLVDYIDRILGTKHPIRTKREEECAVRNAIERPIVSFYRSAYGQLFCNTPDRMRSEIAPIVDSVRQYTWLSEDCIWKVAYEILLWKAIPEEEQGDDCKGGNQVGLAQ